MGMNTKIYFLIISQYYKGRTKSFSSYFWLIVQIVTEPKDLLPYALEANTMTLCFSEYKAFYKVNQQGDKSPTQICLPVC